MGRRENVLNRLYNDSCKMCGNSKERKKMQAVGGFCENVLSAVDQLPVRCVGEWGQDKAFYIKEYVQMAGAGLKNKPRMQPTYIEICSGPGRNIDFSSGFEFDGTPLAVLTTDGASFFNKFIFVDIDEQTRETLHSRIQQSEKIKQEVKDKTYVIKGDYTEPSELINTLKECHDTKEGLNIIVVDPTDMSVPQKLYSQLLRWRRKTDFIINYAEGTDFRRNIERAITMPEFARVREKYERVNPKLKDMSVEDLKKFSLQEFCQLFQDGFSEIFTNYGLTCEVKKDIKNYYKLLYYSSSELGLRFWKTAIKREYSEVEAGQGILFSDIF